MTTNQLIGGAPYCDGGTKRPRKSSKRALNMDAPSKPRKRRLLEGPGGVKKSLIEWARELETRPAVILHRLAAGWGESQAVSVPVMARQRPPEHFLTVNATMSLASWARLMGVETAVLHRRVQLGWSPADIVYTPLHGRRLRTPRSGL